jgi:tripartite-type tricarboxylate transporter receptor subunit TctC
VALAAALLLGVAGAPAQDAYPSKPIRVIVPNPPAGGTDIATRLVAEPLAERLGQRLVIENKPGASGMLGAELTAQATADGHTLMVQPDSFAIASLVLARAPVDIFRDFAPVGIIGTVPMVISVHPSVPARGIAQLVALARAAPGKFEYASAGNGTPQHLIGEMFKRATGTDILHIPYKGAAPAVADTVAGNVKVVVMGLPGVSAPLKSGGLIALTVASGARSKLLPDVPTLGEAGVSGFDLQSWFAFFAPAGTPPAIVARLNAELNAVLQTPELLARFALAGLEPGGGAPDALARRLRADHDRYGKIVAEAGIKAD